MNAPLRRFASPAFGGATPAVWQSQSRGVLGRVISRRVSPRRHLASTTGMLRVEAMASRRQEMLAWRWS
ncbi:hypothetical protein [Hydrogenophaga sp.]|uniref:hypothetical protein n=1 Tax=Hydrogenophaga sp. TaxID=1904254 RepID=UPI0025B9FD9F|nr:hypothetical protein [Hydrogenophaga sp.]